MQSKMGWLVMAAARRKATAVAVAAVLTMGLAACSGDGVVQEEPLPAAAPQVPQKVRVSVGAGIGSDAQTRSAVDYNTSTKQRTLKFTAGDKLYVRAVIELAHDDNYDGPNPEDKHESKLMAGFLDIDASSISADGLSAQFSGDLEIYAGTVTPIYGDKWDDDLEDWVPDVDNIEGYNLEYAAGTHTFATDDPIGECDASADLVHAGSDANCDVNDSKCFYYNFYLAASANELMTSTYRVEGTYNSGTRSFTLNVPSDDGAILYCTVSGLTAGARYFVRLNYGPTADYGEYLDYDGSVSADGSGKATFAIRATDGYDYFYQLLLSGSAERKVLTLGQKKLEPKVYSITATAADYVFPAGQPIVYGTSAWPESDCYGIDEDPADVTIRGTFAGYRFEFWNSGTVRLDNVNASYSGDYMIFGYSDVGDFTVVLTGDNTLSCPDFDYPIGSNSGLKLQCTGASATLTVTGNYKPILGFNCINYDEDKPVSNLAADGYSVELTSTTDGPDADTDGEPDYWTWKYTVTKNP